MTKNNNIINTRSKSKKKKFKVKQQIKINCLKNKKYNKCKIPKALREQVWIKFIGKKYESKCYIRWCKNNITVFDFQSSHNIPESFGGETTLENLRPLCSRCNQSMSNEYTIDEWQKLGGV
jgi:5-methylcytosine-specific restriction endonuclease McrA